MMNVKLEYLDEEIVKDLIKNDMLSAEKNAMREAERYYVNDHDIMRVDFRKSYVYTNDDYTKPELVVNYNSSNHHNVHNYYAELVDQKSSYIVGKPLTVSVEGADDDAELKVFEDELTKYTSDEMFIDVVSDFVTAASNEGRAYLHVYYDSDGELKYVVVPALNVIPIYDTRHENKLTSVIYYYTLTDKSGDTEKTVHKAEWWSDKGVKYFTEQQNGDYAFDCASPHWTERRYIDGETDDEQAASWGRLPYVELKNNKTGTSDLVGVKGLQDAVNLLSSKATNSQIDLVDLFWTIQGYGGETANALQKKLLVNKAVSLNDANGKIEAHQVELNVSERLSWLEMLRRDIYRIGRGFDSDVERVGNATNVALELQYTRLDQKADQLIVKLKLAMKEFMWLITDHINRTLGTSYDSSLVRVDVKKTRIINNTEYINNLISLKREKVIPATLATKLCPYVDDANQTLAELEEQEDRERKAMSDMFLNDDKHDDEQ